MIEEGEQLVLPVVAGPALIAGPVFVCFECPPLPRKVKRGHDPGEPVVPWKKKHNTRVVTARGRAPFVHEYADPESAMWEEAIASIAKAHMRGRLPTARPVVMAMHVFKPVPGSWSKRQRELALARAIRPTGKPDDDNYLKVRDALNGIVWVDDAQCVDSRVIKVYSARPALRIEVRELVDPPV